MDNRKVKRQKFSPEERRHHVEAYLSSGLSRYEYCERNPEISYTTFIIWVQAYERAGLQGLTSPTQYSGLSQQRRGRKEISVALKNEIKDAKKKNENYGARKLSNFLARFRGVKVAPNTVQKTLKAENLELKVQQRRRRSVRHKKVRRFERARAMQLWQSDITSMLLTRYSARVYLTVFLDDYSRYVVSWNLQLRQTTDLVVDALLRGVERFGKPEEVLTDQGRQYFAWRGKSDFEKLLRKQGIKHVVARSHHPQTVGKCERFWETVNDEFWERVKPQDLGAARERFQHFINYYNHFRPHQGIDGMVPADRFFGVESELRKALERTYSENELRLAVGEKPRTPVFLIGQIGDRKISLHGEEGKLVFNSESGERKEFEYERLGHRGNEEGDPGKKTIGETRKEIQDPAPGNASEDSLAPGVGGGAPESTRDGCGDDGILARESDEIRGCTKAEPASDSSLAAVTEGSLGYAGGTALAAESEGNHDDPERRSQGPQKENRGTGENGEDAGRVDSSPQADAGDLPGEEE